MSINKLLNPEFCKLSHTVITRVKYIYLFPTPNLAFRLAAVNAQPYIIKTGNICITDIASNKLFVFYYFIASSTATAQATVAPTIGLLPIPISPIIST